MLGGKPTPSNDPKGELTHLVLVRAFSESVGHINIVKYAPKRGWVNPVTGGGGASTECAATWSDSGK